MSPTDFYSAPLSPYIGSPWVVEAPWVEKYEHAPGAIRVKIKDTFDNILNLIENPSIIVARILDFKIDVQFIEGRSLRELHRMFGNNVLGLSAAQMNSFVEFFKSVDSRPINVQYGVVDLPDSPGDLEENRKSGVCQLVSHISEQCPKIERDTLILFDVIIYAPYTEFVKRNAIANHNESYWKEDLLVDYTCERLIEDIFKTKRDR